MSFSALSESCFGVDQELLGHYFLTFKLQSSINAHEKDLLFFQKSALDMVIFDHFGVKKRPFSGFCLSCSGVM